MRMHSVVEKFNSLAKKKHPFKYLISVLLKRSGLSTLFTIKKEGYKLRFYPSALSGALWVDLHSRHADEKFLRDYLRPGDVVVDVGANVGSLTLEASVIVGDSGKVFAIEAHPKTFEYLWGNIELNQVKNVCACNVALGDAEGAVLFSDTALDDQNSVITDGDGVKVPMYQLDRLPIDGRRIDLLKVDVEGYEKFVLQGARQTLQITECIYFESWEQHFQKYGYTCNDLFEFLNSCGFQLFKISQETIIFPVPKGYISINNENLLAIRNLDRFLQRTSFRLESNCEI